MYAVLAFLELYMFQCLVQYIACLFSAACRTVLVHFHPKSGLVPFPFGTWSVFLECRTIQTWRIV